ncbi:TatD family hydrolase [Nemorincola caseinilytica]|uniref:TatD family hydrolase n=2 Tax=Nemorincola caseinilytica TaxID=2054315 RepID=A0ABP8NNP9_9BACT
MATYYDIHTHNTAARTGTLSIVALYEQFSSAYGYPACSIGLHPWYLQDHEAGMRELEQYASSPNVLAIGECGMDKVCDTDLQLQARVFEQQVALAQRIGKPLVIHCVRAYDEVLAILSRERVTVPVIFHGFNKKKSIADILVSKGYYLSFGSALLKEGTPAIEVLREIPAEKFFLETDSSGLSIADIYAKATEIRKTTEDAIILQLTENFKTVFNR